MEELTTFSSNWLLLRRWVLQQPCWLPWKQSHGRLSIWLRLSLPWLIKEHARVMNLPNIGRAPLGVASSDHGQLLTQVSQLFNITLAAAFKLQQRRFGGKVTLIDAFNFIDGVIANFRTYGFRVSTAGAGCNLAAQVQKASKLGLSNPSLFASSLFCSPSTYTTIAADYSFMFADMVHPTTHLNALFALFVEQQIAPNIW
jgi:phospholipase/lecithinase/hemolysin